MQARDQVSDTYQKAGFLAAARFYRNTTKLAIGGPVNASPVESPIAWEATEYDLSDESTRAAKEVNALLQDWQVDQAIARIEDELERKPSLQMVVEWSDAALMKILADKGEVSDEAKEAAVRIFITSLDEKVNKPFSVGRAGGYKKLSDVFSALDDPYSSLTAAVMALIVDQRASEWDSLGPVTKRQVCDRTRTLARSLHLRENFWPTGLDYSRVCGKL